MTAVPVRPSRRASYRTSLIASSLQVFINVIDVAKAHYEAVARATSNRYLFIGGENANSEIARILKVSAAALGRRSRLIPHTIQEEFPEQAHRIPTKEAAGATPNPHWSWDSSPFVSLLPTSAAGQRLTFCLTSIALRRSWASSTPRCETPSRLQGSSSFRQRRRSPLEVSPTLGNGREVG